MKPANVVEVRDVRASEKHDPAYTDPTRRARAEELLSAYPNTSDEETMEIVQFLARGMHLDVGLVSAKDEFKTKVAEIRHNHRDAFRLRPLEIAIFLLIVFTPLLAMVLATGFLGRG